MIISFHICAPEKQIGAGKQIIRKQVETNDETNETNDETNETNDETIMKQIYNMEN